MNKRLGGFTVWWPPIFDRTKLKLRNIIFKAFHHLDSTPLPGCLSLLEIRFSPLLHLSKSQSFKIITSEQLFPVSLVSRCPCFWSASVSITVVVITWDALIVKCPCVCLQAAWGQESFPAAHLPAPSHRTWHSAVRKRHSSISTWQARNSRAGSWVCVHICVCVCVCTPVHVSTCLFSLCWSEEAIQKKTKGSGCALCIVQVLSSSTFPDTAELNSRSPDFHMRRMQIEKCLFHCNDCQKLWQAPVTCWWQG